MKYKEIELKINLYVPFDVCENNDEIAKYLNNKLWDDPEFFGYIEENNIAITKENINL